MTKKKKIVVFTGSGVSAESGISTFRGGNGLWANHRIEDICTPEALIYNRQEVIDFYNTRRKELLETTPNAAHYAITELEKHFDVQVITQNIDDLHERAGSKNITHLHGELRKLRSSKDETATIPFEDWEQKMETKHADGSLLRPFIVFFGESVPEFDKAMKIAQQADILLVIGTSLAVYPAASLVHCVPNSVPIYLVDPGEPNISGITNPLHHIKMNASEGVPKLVEMLIKEIE